MAVWVMGVWAMAVWAMVVRVMEMNPQAPRTQACGSMVKPPLPCALVGPLTLIGHRVEAVIAVLQLPATIFLSWDVAVTTRMLLICQPLVFKPVPGFVSHLLGQVVISSRLLVRVTVSWPFWSSLRGIPRSIGVHIRRRM
jgi:hypothetical protein